MQPQFTDYPPFYRPYVERASGAFNNLLQGSLDDLSLFLHSIPESKADFAYAADKWSVKQVLQHCIDTERVFAYRALCHARGEQQPLPGFDQNDYADHAALAHRSLGGLIEEAKLVRQTTSFLFEQLTEADLQRTGYIGDHAIKTFCWAYIIVGHFKHHEHILTTQYKIDLST